MHPGVLEIRHGGPRSAHAGTESVARGKASAPHSSIEPQRFGLPKARIKRWIHVAGSAMAEVDADTMLNTTG